MKNTSRYNVYVIQGVYLTMFCYVSSVWLDVRTSKIVDDLIANKGVQSANAVKQSSGLPLSTYFSAVKIRWLLQNVPAVKNAVADGECLVGTVDTWLIWVSFFADNWFKNLH